MARVRSPNYPIISFPDAIDRVRKVYEREHLHKAAPEVVAKALGYSSLNGASLGVISALKKYGLLEEIGADLKVSAEALTILVDPPSSIERAKLIRKAVQAPALFQKLMSEYGERLPSDENLRSTLLKMGFAPTAVDTPIRSYRETINFVSSLPTESQEEVSPPVDWDEAPVSQDAGRPSVIATANIPRAVVQEVPSTTASKRDTWDLPEGMVILETPSEMSAESLDILEAWLSLALKKIKMQVASKSADKD